VIWREKAIEQIKQVFPAQANALIDHMELPLPSRDQNQSSEGSRTLMMPSR